jgi:hypothetical protein
MVDQVTKRIALSLVIGLAFSSCGYFSKTAQDQRAYDRYVRRNSGIHYKEQLKMAKIKSKPQRIEAPPPSDPRVTAEAADGPQAASSGETQNE